MSAETVVIEEEPRPGRGRRCVARRVAAPREGMLRFVVAPDGRLVFDAEERLPGRGIWLSADRGAIRQAVAKQLFAKAARARVQVSPRLADEVEAVVVRRCLDYFGLARRAGAFVAGYDKVDEWLRQGKAGLLVTAQDAAANQRDRLVALAAGRPVVDLFSREEVGRAVGREAVTYAAMAPGRLAEGLLREAGRLRGLRESGPEGFSQGAGEQEKDAIKT
ncbi:RNA-binding protein [Marinimicrococcus flavescens]|uniref:RNA-binding protein n=1 Tax=Marinimicrococcus flavescens TaxID=3031815 RepID=A0AAP3UZV7_9PROT|nr:RNA-binding protein [Marinimicrococcus flavescens]